MLTLALIVLVFAAALFLRFLPMLHLPEPRARLDYLLIVLGGVLVALPGVAMVEPAVGRWLPGVGTGALLFMFGAAVVTAAGACLCIVYGRSGAAGSTSRMFSWVLAAGGVILQAFTWLAPVTPGSFSALRFLAAGVFIAALFLASLIFAAYSYRVTPRPRSYARLIEAAWILLVGYTLLLPAIHVAQISSRRVVGPPNKQLQQTGMDKVPSHIRDRATAELRR